VRTCGAGCCYVLEATGSYYLALAYFLVERGAPVTVRNPLVVRRFSQMHPGKGKSDRKDAQWLLRYGQQQPLPAWQPDDAVLVECRQSEQVSEQLIRQKTLKIQTESVIGNYTLRTLILDIRLAADSARNNDAPDLFKVI